MKIALFGATGGTGRQIAEQGLAAGHEIKALVRTPAKFDLEHKNLEVIAGNVLEMADVVQTIDGCQAVISSLGNTSRNPKMVVSMGTQHIMDTMEKQGIKRLIVVSSLGVGDSKDQTSFLFKIVAKTFLRNVMADKEQTEALIRKSDLDWTIVRPGGISRGDVADFVLKQLDDLAFLRSTPGIV